MQPNVSPYELSWRSSFIALGAEVAPPKHRFGADQSGRYMLLSFETEADAVKFQKWFFEKVGRDDGVTPQSQLVKDTNKYMVKLMPRQVEHLIIGYNLFNRELTGSMSDNGALRIEIDSAARKGYIRQFFEFLVSLIGLFDKQLTKGYIDKRGEIVQKINVPDHDTMAVKGYLRLEERECLASGATKPIVQAFRSQLQQRDSSGVSGVMPTGVPLPPQYGSSQQQQQTQQQQPGMSGGSGYPSYRQ